MNTEAFGEAQVAKEALQRLSEHLLKAWNGGECRLTPDRIEQLNEQVAVIEKELPVIKGNLGKFSDIALKN